MHEVEPILAVDALNHFLVHRVFRVGVRAMTIAVQAHKVLVVAIAAAGANDGFRRIQLAGRATLFDAAIASEIALSVQFNKLVLLVAMERTSQADP